VAGASVHLVDSDIVADAKTDASGRFAFTEVPAGAMAYLTITKAGYNQVWTMAVIPDSVDSSSVVDLLRRSIPIGGSGVPENDASVDLDVMLFVLDGSYAIKVMGLVNNPPPLAALDSIGMFPIPCSGQQYSGTCSGTVTVEGVYTPVGSVGDDHVLGTITFSGVPGALDLFNWCTTLARCSAPLSPSNSLVLTVAEPQAETYLYVPQQAEFTVGVIAGSVASPVSDLVNVTATTPGIQLDTVGD